MSTLADAAAAYAADGWPVGPLNTPILDAPCDCTDEEIERSPKAHPPGRTDGTHTGCSCARRKGGVCRHDQAGKHPRTPNGSDDFTSDAATVAAWWKKWPQANIGGRLDLFDVLDIDQPGRVPADVRLAMPIKVPTQTTGRGFHYFFEKCDPVLAPPTNLSFGEFKTKGYVLLSPSVHPSGVEYSWRRSPASVAPPVMPKGLSKALHKARRSANGSTDQRDPNELLAIALAALESLGITPTEDDRGGWRATCPVHGLDGEAHAGDSLALRVGHSALLAYCFAGCDFGAIARKLGVAIQRDDQAAQLHWMASQPPVDLHELLDDIIALIRRFWIADDEAYTAVALWTVHTWVFDVAHCTPRLWIRSATKRSGKTRLYEVMSPLLPGTPSIETVPTAPVIFRRAGEGRTFLFDEIDQWLTTASESGAAIVGVLNNGYKRGGVVPRCVGDDNHEVEFPVFAPVAYAGIGRVTDTLADRSIPITMRRRIAGEQPIERFHGGRYAPEAAPLAERIELWAWQRRHDLERLLLDDKIAPIGVDNDRVEEIWPILLAIAELAAGEWPANARTAARMLHGAVVDDEDDSTHVQLLGHFREVFAGQDWPEEITTADMRRELTKEGEWPWATYKGGRAVSDHAISRMMGMFGIKSFRPVVGHARYGLRVWQHHDLRDAFLRYLPNSPFKADTADTTDTTPSTWGDVDDDGVPIESGVRFEADTTLEADTMSPDITAGQGNGVHGVRGVRFEEPISADEHTSSNGWHAPASEEVL